MCAFRRPLDFENGIEGARPTGIGKRRRFPLIREEKSNARLRSRWNYCSDRAGRVAGARVVSERSHALPGVSLLWAAPLGLHRRISVVRFASVDCLGASDSCGCDVHVSVRHAHGEAASSLGNSFRRGAVSNAGGATRCSARKTGRFIIWKPVESLTKLH